MKRHVKHELKEEGPTIWVGKDGLSPQLLGEFEKQLERTKMVKIRILPNALHGEVTAKSIAENAAKQTSSALVEVRGHVFILYRRRKKTQTPDTLKEDQPKP